MEYRSSLLDEVGEIVRGAVSAILDNSLYSSKKVRKPPFSPPKKCCPKKCCRLDQTHGNHHHTRLNAFPHYVGERLDPYDSGRLPARARGLEPALQVLTLVRALSEKRGGLSLCRVTILGWTVRFHLRRALGERSHTLPGDGPCRFLASDRACLEWDWCGGDGRGGGGLASAPVARPG